MEFVRRILVAIFVLLVGATVLRLRSRKKCKQDDQRPTNRDRALLELAGDLAELYRNTGRK